MQLQSQPIAHSNSRICIITSVHKLYQPQVFLVSNTFQFSAIHTCSLSESPSDFSVEFPISVLEPKIVSIWVQIYSNSSTGTKTVDTIAKNNRKRTNQILQSCVHRYCLAPPQVHDSHFHFEGICPNKNHIAVFHKTLLSQGIWCRKNWMVVIQVHHCKTVSKF